MLLDQEHLVLQDADIVAAAAKLYRSGIGSDFADCMIMEVARGAGHLPLGTFDRKLTQHAVALRAEGVVSLILFGSVARREARPDSDVDLIAEFDRPIGYFALFRLRDQLSEWLGHPVDLTTADSLRPEVRERVRSDGLRVA